MVVLETVDQKRLAELREREEFFWCDLTDPDPADVKALGEALDLHPVAIEDSIEFGQRPKLDSYEHHVLFVFYTVRRSATATTARPRSSPSRSTSTSPVSSS